jgi:hypothetical protein
MAHDFAGISGWEIRARYASRILLRWLGKVTIRERERENLSTIAFQK